MGSPENVCVDDNRKWSRAALRIFGETLDPDEVSAKLGLAPTRIHLKGERRSPRYSAVWRDSAWFLNSPLGLDASLSDHLKWLLDTLEPRLEIITELSTKYRVDLFLGFSSGNGQGGFGLDSITLRRLASLGLFLNLDLYPPPMESDDTA